MWQYSSSGNVDGINGNVDMDIAYKDYPSIIKSCGLNGYKVTDEGEEIHELKAGERIDLQNAPLYISSSAKRKARNVNGVYYVYDGKEINGRYRITKSRSRVEKKPTAINVTGWINKEDAV